MVLRKLFYAASRSLLTTMRKRVTTKTVLHTVKRFDGRSRATREKLLSSFRAHDTKTNESFDILVINFLPRAKGCRYKELYEKHVEQEETIFSTTVKHWLSDVWTLEWQISFLFFFFFFFFFLSSNHVLGLPSRQFLLGRSVRQRARWHWVVVVVE